MSLCIIGTGIKRPSQLTLEGVAALKIAKRVLHLTATAESMEPLFRELGVQSVVSLDELYRHGDVDDDNYDRIAAEVVSQVRQYGDVALLLYGHPRVGVTLTGKLEALLPEEVRVIPAPSSFDTMINDLRRDPLKHGSVLVDANRLLLFEQKLDPTMDCYVFHVDAVATRKTASDSPNSSRWDLLATYLLQYYPAEHQAVVIASAAGAEPAEFAELRLGELGLAEGLMATGATLFIPARLPRSFNRQIRDLLTGSA